MFDSFVEIGDKYTNIMDKGTEWLQKKAGDKVFDALGIGICVLFMIAMFPFFLLGLAVQAYENGPYLPQQDDEDAGHN